MDATNKFSAVVSKRLTALGVSEISNQVIRSVIRTLHTASMITEEGRFVQGSITLANPEQPDRPPRLQRADYPKFTQLHTRVPLTPEFFAKLARAVDRWSGSIAVWGEGANSLQVWGIVDQLVGTNVSLNRESEGGFSHPGLLTVIIDRPGDVTAYHGKVFLGSLRSQRPILSEAEAFNSSAILDKLVPTFETQADAISTVLRKLKFDYDKQQALQALLREWKVALARICIGLRRLGTGGSLLLTPKPLDNILSVSHLFAYDRLRSALALHAVDEAYQDLLWRSISERKSITWNERVELEFADTDLKDRSDEVSGAVKLVTSLAAMDGALLMKPDLSVIGFGAKIGSGSDPKIIYDGEEFALKGVKAKRVDTSRYGTRHGSVLRYCNEDPLAIGVIISQDGHVRIASKTNGCMALWDCIQLLNQSNFSDEVVKHTLHHRKRVGLRKKSVSFGYSRMPKSLEQLVSGKLNKGLMGT